MEKVAIVILNWNGSSMMKQYLPSVLQYSRDEATVYVADNASTDDSLIMLSEHFPEVKQIVMEATTRRLLRLRRNTSCC